MSEPAPSRPPAAGPRWPDGLYIEQGDLGDALATVALLREIAAEDRWLVTHPDEAAVTLEQRRRDIEHATSADNALFLVARSDGRRILGQLQVVGGAWSRERHVGRVELLVAPSARRRGIGRALLEEGMARAKGGGVLKKLSVAVFADNSPALGLFRSVGFQDEGRRIAQYRERDGRLRGDLLLARFL
jgi:ribosomal protein S18 acetylase RimI-like enzyme